MKIELPDSDQFNLKDCIIAGDECVLITPKGMDVEWNDENKIFRSSIWRKSDMHPISLGFKKFVNLGEQPLFEPNDKDTDLEFLVKKDGSLLIVSKYKGELIVRTRGTIDASQLENGYEIEFLKKKYPRVFDNLWLQSENYSLLFEWTTPTNRIVLKESEEPTLWLIGIVSHIKASDDTFMLFMGVTQFSYRYFTQFELDQQAIFMEVPRPERYELNLLNVSEYLKDKDTIEGVVIYSNNGQTLKKVKTPRYLYMHRVFTGVKTVNHLFDLFVEYGQPQRENFEALLAINYDWELVKALTPLMDELYNKIRLITYKIMQINVYLNNPDFIALDRKGKAQKILQQFPNDSGIAFALLDNKKIPLQKYWETFKQHLE